MIIGGYEWRIKTIDMSLTQIVEFPTEYSSWGLFYNQPTIESIILPGNLVNLGSRTFAELINLKNIKIPETVSDMSGERLFYKCSSLTNINIPKNFNSTKIGDYAFVGTKFSSFIVPDSVIELGDGVFSRSNELRTIQLPKNLQKIGKWCFEGLPNLKEITIPDTVTTIGSDPFYLTSDIIVYVTSNEVEKLVKAVFKGTVINLNRP